MSIINSSQTPVPLSELPEINSTENTFVFAAKENADGSSDSGKLAVSKIQEEVEKKKGYFNSYESLIADYPNPRQAGETAYVGTPFPGTVYDVVSGAWHNTGNIPPADEVPLNDYMLSGGTSKTGQQLDEEKAEKNLEDGSKVLYVKETEPADGDMLVRERGVFVNKHLSNIFEEQLYYGVEWDENIADTAMTRI